MRPPPSGSIHVRSAMDPERVFTPARIYRLIWSKVSFTDYLPMTMTLGSLSPPPTV